MGQQQLLLIILVTIIVGIATVVAINTFSSASDSANVDAARQDMIALASDAQGYFMQPTMMGGGGQSFDNMEMADLNCPGNVADATTCETENGTYVLSNVGGNSFDITGTPSTAGGTLTATVEQDGIAGSIDYTAGT